MTDKELEKLEKNSIYMMRADPTIKDQVVVSQLNELNRIVKKEVKRADLIVMVMPIK